MVSGGFRRGGGRENFGYLVEECWGVVSGGFRRGGGRENFGDLVEECWACHGVLGELRWDPKPCRA